MVPKLHAKCHDPDEKINLKAMAYKLGESFVLGRKAAIATLVSVFPFVVWSGSNVIQPTTVVAIINAGGKLYGQTPDLAITKHYYIAAEPQLWDFAPEARDVVCGMPLPPTIQLRHANGKIRYVEYTDATFAKRVNKDPSLGILGPVLRGVVGQNIAVTFWQNIRASVALTDRRRNPTDRAKIPLSMHPHGLKYDKDSEGSYYQPSPGLGAAVAPDARFTYVWQIDESAGPSPSEPSSKAWLYHSHVSGDDEINMGLIGFIIVTDPKRARPDGTPNDVDREFGSLFMIFNEGFVDAAAAEAAEHGIPVGNLPAKPWAQIQELKEQGQRAAINGRIYGNLSGLEMNAGERVRWYLFALGSENDFHTPHWHGLRVVESGRSTDVVELMPGNMKVADMVADNPGSWLFHCHVAEHMMEGMFARVTVYSTNEASGRRAAGTPFLGLH
jgi:FtsP/CotA-like multicopper oxidase with cupredoxin domain